MKLKPCPFCGSKARIFKRESSYDLSVGFDARCKNNRCYLADGADFWFDTEEELIESWNRRETDG
jgi:Lar family restriction alleviation protein